MTAPLSQKTSIRGRASVAADCGAESWPAAESMGGSAGEDLVVAASAGVGGIR
jgi:hypothetical protein